MNIYLIEQDENTNYDTYDSAIVTAETEDQARLTHPTGKPNWDGKDENYSVWCGAEYVTVTLIGKSDVKINGVLLASFNAG